jgi:putative peptidoglycan lipid II flippase
LVRILAFGFAETPGKLGLTASLTRIIFPFLLWVAMSAWAMGILNSHGNFFLPAVAPGCFNLVSILIAIGSYGWFRSQGMEPIFGMAWGVMLGGLAQFLVQLPLLWARGFRYSPRINLRDGALGRVFRLWAPLTLGFGAARLNVAVDTFLASLLEEGSITYLNYGYRVMHLPLGLFGVGVGSVALPELSRRLALKDSEGAKELLDRALRMVSVLTIPTSILLIALAKPICGLVYQHGEFTSLDTIFTAQALALYGIGIWAMAATRSLAAAFYALKDTRTPTWVGLGVVGLNAGLNLALMGPLRFRAFALTTSVCAFVNFFLLWRLLGRRMALPSKTFKAALQILLASGVAGIGALIWARLIPVQADTLGWFYQVLGGGLIGLLIFYLLARLSGISEVDETLKGLFRR